MIDSHCHLGIDDFKEDIDGCLIRAKEQGVSNILTVACSYEDVDDLIKMSSRERVYTAFGIHPGNAGSFDYLKTKSVFEKNPKIVAVGEIGLDYFYNPETKNEQIFAFQKQIELAHELKKPIIIHTRDADAETIRILKENYNNNLLNKKGVMHCFCGGYELARTALDVGFYISVSGIITFKNAVELREVIKSVPLNRLLIETDAPYLAPVPFRGKRNEPSYLRKTLEALANLKEVDVHLLEELTTKNFFDLFKGE